MRLRRSSELVNLYPVVCMESNCCAFNFLGLPNLSFCKLFTETFNGGGVSYEDSLVFFFLYNVIGSQQAIMIMKGDLETVVVGF